jgi:aldehyde oxidoreductase
MLKRLFLDVNGTMRQVLANPEENLAQVLRAQLGLTGTKIGCGSGQCGACSVLLNGKVTRSCVTKMKRVPDGAKIVTIEGIGTPQRLHPLQLAFMVHGAAQCGFCIPGFLVSAKGLLDENVSPSRENVRAWFQRHRNVCRCNGYKPAVDAVMDAARVMRGEITMEDLSFKMPDDGRIWNTRYPRPSALAKVTGTCDYGADLGLKLPQDTLQLALVQAKISHANIISIDTSEAEKMPGVYKVITHKDVKGGNRIFGMLVFPWRKDDGYDRPILCDDKVFQYGDAIAVVCADTKQNARAAAEKVKVELEELPAYMNALDAVAEDAMEIHPGSPNVYSELNLIKGEDVEPIFEKAAYVVEDDFYTQRQPHLVIEPDVGFSYIDEDGVVTVQSKSITLYNNRRMLAEGLGLELGQLRLIQNPMGADFGYKLSPTLEALCAVATMATGRPAFLEYDYYQLITYTGKRAPVYSKVKMAADKNGNLLAFKSDALIDHGAYSEYSDALITKVLRNMGTNYNIPNIRGYARCTFTNHAFGTAFRAFGSPQTHFASEVLMDMMAENIGADPWEFRYRNVHRPGSTMPCGCEMDVYPLPTLMEMMKPKYDAALARAKKETTPGKKRGVGLAVGLYNVALDTADTAHSDIALNPDGTVTVYNTWEDHGQGGDIGILSTAHEALRPLGLKPEQIKFYLNDTARCPNSGPASGSRSQYMVGNAIVDSCRKLMDAMRKPEGTYRTYDEMVKEGIPTRYNGTFTIAPYCTKMDPETCQYNPVPTYMYGVFLAEVEVDTSTGRVKVLGMVLNADIGVIANRLAVDGQMLGGLAQGIGLALSEDFDDLKKHTNMKACGIPYILDVPDALEVNYLETPRATGPYGAAGCGELPLTSPHAAIINAIYHACGVRITDLPALPEKVLAGLKAKE